MRWFCFPAVSLKALFLFFRNPWLFLNPCCSTGGILGVCPERWLSSRARAFCSGGPALRVLLLSPFPFMRLFTGVSIRVKTQDKFISSNSYSLSIWPLWGYICVLQMCSSVQQQQILHEEESGILVCMLCLCLWIFSTEQCNSCLLTTGRILKLQTGIQA